MDILHFHNFYLAISHVSHLPHLQCVEESNQDAAEARALHNLKMVKKEARARAFAFVITMTVP